MILDLITTHHHICYDRWPVNCHKSHSDSTCITFCSCVLVCFIILDERLPSNAEIFILKHVLQKRTVKSLDNEGFIFGISLMSNQPEKKKIIYQIYMYMTMKILVLFVTFSL